MRTNASPRRLALLSALLAAALWLAGCQQTPDELTRTAVVTQAGRTPTAEATPRPARTATQAATATPAEVLGADLDALRGLQIEFGHPWHGELEQRAREAAQEFNRKNPWGLRVQVHTWYSAGALYESLAEAQADKTKEAANLPNVIAATTEQLAFWAQGSDPMVVDLTRYVVDSRTGLSEAEIAAYDPRFWAQDTSGSTRFGFPALRGARVLFYNLSWAQELGFSRPPATPAEFKAQACAAAEKNNAARLVDLYGTGGWLIDTDSLTTMSWLSAFGANPIPEKEGQPYAFQSPQSEEALEFLSGMITDGCAWIARSASPYEHFSQRKALFYAGTLSDLYTQAGWQAQAQSEDRWTILPFPGKDGQPVVYSAGYSYGVLNGTPEEQLGGWLFASWLARPENAARLAEAMPSLPVSQPVAEQLSDYRRNFPWDQILPLADAVRPAPGNATWRAARRPLEDAAWQLYHLPPDGLDQILPYLDETVQEILNQ